MESVSTESDRRAKNWVDEPEYRPECYPSLAISEKNPFRTTFTLVVSFALVYVGTILPYRIAFMEFHIPEAVDPGPVWSAVVWLVDVTFGMDLVLNFFFTFKDEHEREVRCLRRIACRYVRSSFIVDFLSCLPPQLLSLILVAMMDLEAEDTTLHKSPWLMKIHRIPRLAKLVRIFRLVKMVDFLRRYQVVERIRSTRIARVMYFVAGFCLIAHITACGWYLVAALHADFETSWIARRYSGVEEDIFESSPGKDWLQSMYFVLTVFTTVGFGDISAFTTGEMVYVIFAMILGTMANGVIMGEMINSIALVDQVSCERKSQTQLLESFSEHTQLGEDVAFQLVNFIKKTQDVHRTYERSQIKLLIMRNVFPRALAQQVPHSLFHGQLLQNRLFCYCRRLGPIPFQLPLFVALAVHQKFMVINDVAYDAGDQPNSIHLVLTGVFASLERRRLGDANGPLTTDTVKNAELEPNGSDGKYVKIGELYPAQLFCRRSYFGDMEIMQDIITRCQSVRCESDGSMLVIEKHDIAELTQEFPRHMILLRQAAIRRWQRRSKKHRLPDERPYLLHQDLAAWSIQKHWVVHLARKRRNNSKDCDTTPRAILLQGHHLSTGLYAAGEIATQGGISTSASVMMNIPGRKQHHQDDIFTPSIQKEVDLVRTDVQCLRGEVGQLRTDMTTVGAKLDKVMDALNRLVARPLTL